MLLLCIGPDTFRAQEKARELEFAFREKHDAGGSSMERLSPGKEGFKQLLERANTASLFAPRRLMRTSCLISECPKVSLSILIQALSKDPDNIIVISVEDKQLSDDVTKRIADIPKLYKYEFPEQTGYQFNKWLQDRAISLGFHDEKRVHLLAEMTDGDSWLAWNELMKLVAGNTEDFQRSRQAAIYEYADRYICDAKPRYSFLADQDAQGEALQAFISQSRAMLRVRDRDIDGLKPFIVKKMQNNIKNCNTSSDIHSLLRHALLSQRFGYGSEEEVTAIL